MLKTSRAPKSTAKRITFVLPSDHPAGTVSVVGDFNDWTPGANVLRKRSNGTMSTSVDVAPGSELRFRFLGENGFWFDDADADLVDAQGSIVKVA